MMRKPNFNDKAEEQLRAIVFYKVNEENKLVTIYAIVDGRREYRNLI